MSFYQMRLPPHLHFWSSINHQSKAELYTRTKTYLVLWTVWYKIQKMFISTNLCHFYHNVTFISGKHFKTTIGVIMGIFIPFRIIFSPMVFWPQTSNFFIIIKLKVLVINIIFRSWKSEILYNEELRWLKFYINTI